MSVDEVWTYALFCTQDTAKAIGAATCSFVLVEGFPCLWSDSARSRRRWRTSSSQCTSGTSSKSWRRGADRFRHSEGRPGSGGQLVLGRPLVAVFHARRVRVRGWNDPTRVCYWPYEGSSDSVEEYFGAPTGSPGRLGLWLGRPRSFFFLGLGGGEFQGKLSRAPVGCRRCFLLPAFVRFKVSYQTWALY